MNNNIAVYRSRESFRVYAFDKRGHLYTKQNGGWVPTTTLPRERFKVHEFDPIYTDFVYFCRFKELRK